MSKCTKFSTAPVCFNDGTNDIPLVAHYEYGVDDAGDSILVATRFTDADGVPVDTSAGTVTAGACPIPPVFAPDIETKTVCDFLANGTVVEFCRTTITSFTETGAVDTRTVADFAIDGVTPYVVQGTEGACNQDCDPSTAQGVLTTW